MRMAPKVKKVTKEGDFYHVRYRQPGRFSKIRTPDWASNVADSVSKGAEVRMGMTSAGNWYPQGILIETTGVRGKNHARSLASRIRKKIED